MPRLLFPILLVPVLAAGLAAGLVAQPDARVAGASATAELTGHLRHEQGIDILFLHGDNAQRGFTEGYLMAPVLRELVRKFGISPEIVPNALMWNAVVLPGVRTRVTVPDWVRARFGAILHGMEARDPDLLEIPELRRELTVDDLVALSTIPDFMGLACSSFAVWGERTAGQGPVVGRNLDYRATDELLAHTMIVVHAPRGDRHGWVSIGWPGFAGTITGISDRGVFVAVHDVRARARKGVRVTPRLIALQELIERLDPAGDPAEDAAELLRGFRFGMGGNVMLAWHGQPGPDGVSPVGAAVLELDSNVDRDGGVTVRAPDNRPLIACSNHHRLRAKQRDCWRYQALLGGASELPAGALDVDKGLELIGQAENDKTLYQTVVDLDAFLLTVRARRKVDQDEWLVVRKLDIRALLAEAAAGHPVAVAGSTK